MVYLTDWKFDHTPVDGRPTDTTFIADLGQRQPLALITDCVRVEFEGLHPQRAGGRRGVRQHLQRPRRARSSSPRSPRTSRGSSRRSTRRAYGRKVAGRAQHGERRPDRPRPRGYLHAKIWGAAHPRHEAAGSPEQIAIVCTGSRASPWQRWRMANRDHQHVNKDGATPWWSRPRRSPATRSRWAG